jgi:hypothetical protein
MAAARKSRYLIFAFPVKGRRPSPVPKITRRATLAKQKTPAKSTSKTPEKAAAPAKKEAAPAKKPAAPAKKGK